MTIMGPTAVKACPSCNQLIRENTYLSGNTFGAQQWTDGYMFGPMMPSNKEFVKCPKCSNLISINNAEVVGEINMFGIGPCDLSDEEILADIRETMIRNGNDPDELGLPNTPIPGHIVEKRKRDAENTRKFLSISLDPIDPDFEDYDLFLKSGKLTKKNERSVRILAWWGSNIEKRLSGYEYDISDHIGRSNHPDGKCPRKDIDSDIFNVDFSQKQLDNIEILSSLMNENDSNDRLLKAEMARQRGMLEEAMRLLDYTFPEKYSDAVEAMKLLCMYKIVQVAQINATLNWESIYLDGFSPSDHPTSG